MNDASMIKANNLAHTLQQAQAARERASTEAERKDLDIACEKLASELKAAVGGAE